MLEQRVTRRVLRSVIQDNFISNVLLSFGNENAGIYLCGRMLCHSCYIFRVTFQVQKLSKNEILMVNIGSLSSGGRVLAVKADLAKIGLTSPVCTEIGEKIALSRRVEKHWR